MRWRVYWICVLACFWAVSLSCVHAEPPLNEQYLHIFLKMNDAEQLQKQGDYRGALAIFSDCYDKLERIHKSDPDWETALVVKRIEDCQSKLAELKPMADAQAQVPPPPPVTPPAPPPVAPPQNPAPTPSPSTDNSLPSDVPTLQAQLTALKQELIAMQEERDVIQHKYDAVQAENQTLKQQLVALNAQLDSLKNQQSVDDRVGKLMTQNTELTDKLAAAEQELDQYKADPKSTLALVRAQLKNAKDQLAQTQSQNDALQQTATTLKQQLDQAQDALNTANQKLASTGAGSADYDKLKRDNEIMRDILTRELQEQAHRDMAVRLYQEEYDRLKISSKVLEENMDIIRSPMTAPTTDEERDLLASLKVQSEDVVPPPPVGGNTFSAQAPGTGTNSSPADTTSNAVPAAPTTTAADNSTPPANATPATTTSDNSAPAAPPAPTNQAPVTVTIGGDPSTAATLPTNPPASPPANTPPPATDPSTTSTTQTTTTQTTTPAATPPDTATSNAMPAVTPPAPPDQGSTPTPPAPADNSTPSTPSTPSDTNQTTTTVTQTTVQNGTNSQDDPTRFADKPRLPDDVHDTAQAAADLFKMGRFDEAAAKYEEIIAKYPESLYAWSNLGVVRFQQKNYDAALRALQQAVKLSPADAFSYSNLGIVYYQMGQFDSAISALEKALALEPNDAKSHNYLGCACSQKGWQEVAEKEFLKAIAIDDSFGDAHFNLALVYATEKPPSLELARRHYNRALELGIAKDDRLEKLLQIPQ